MKSRLKKILAAFLVLMLVLGNFTTISAKAADDAGNSEEGYFAFIALGADSSASGAWDVQYYGPDAESNVGDVTAVNAYIKPGETKTISLTVPTILYTWFTAPCVITNGADTSLFSFDVSLKINGEDVAYDASAGAAFWAEGTGAYTAEQCLRLAGGYNEWGDKYLAESPKDFTTIEYTITLNDGYLAFIALGADSSASGAWDVQYYGPDAESNVGDVTAVNAYIKPGETKTISLTVPTILHTWFNAPCVILNDVNLLDSYSFDVTAAIDGADVAIDFAAGAAAWYEGTGAYTAEQCVRLAGGYNEWGDKYLADSPKDFTTISYTIKMDVADTTGVEPTPTPEPTAAPEVTYSGSYMAYLGVQTNTTAWIFRNAYDDATYGHETDYFNHLTGYVGSADEKAYDGTFTDAEIKGDGTYTVKLNAADFADEQNMSLIFVSTNIPLSDKISVTDVSIKINGSTKYKFAEAVMDPDSVDYVKFLCQNIWNSDVKDLFAIMFPVTDVEVTFTISGMGYTNEEAVPTAVPTTSAVATPTAVPSSSSNATEVNPIVIVIIVVAVIAVVAVVAVVIYKKKKA